MFLFLVELEFIIPINWLQIYVIYLVKQHDHSTVAPSCNTISKRVKLVCKIFLFFFRPTLSIIFSFKKIIVYFYFVVEEN